MPAKKGTRKDTLYVYIPLGLKDSLKHEALARSVSLSALVASYIMEQHDSYTAKSRSDHRKALK
jgi:hypothetical protein